MERWPLRAIHWGLLDESSEPKQSSKRTSSSLVERTEAQ